LDSTDNKGGEDRGVGYGENTLESDDCGTLGEELRGMITSLRLRRGLIGG